LEKVVCPLVLLTTVTDNVPSRVLAVEFTRIFPVIVPVRPSKLTVVETGIPFPTLGPVTNVPVCKFSKSGGGQQRIFAGTN